MDTAIAGVCLHATHRGQQPNPWQGWLWHDYVGSDQEECCPFVVPGTSLTLTRLLHRIRSLKNWDFQDEDTSCTSRGHFPLWFFEEYPKHPSSSADLCLCRFHMLIHGTAASSRRHCCSLVQTPRECPCCSPTLFLQQFSRAFLCNTLLPHFFTTHFSIASLQFYNTLLRSNNAFPCISTFTLKNTTSKSTKPRNRLQL